ncbi:hypothetical protein NP493_126g07011 [Ridgeia piscesae]|uniref:Uncharacterized protein n=1 Tax=Ridgeia piscesae TaxID=27915 RepID=A0AAD9UGI8_RIDPI|nr:hypothetical protein NP493_126g07011 [Ridgeia piscesae]
MRFELVHYYVDIRGQCKRAKTSSEMLHEVYCLFDSELECQGYLQQSQTSEKIYASSCCLLRKNTGHGRSGRRYVSRKAIHSCTSNYLFKFCFSQLQINIRDKK